MNLTALIQFVPLIVGLLVAYHLVIRQGLPSKNLGQIISYFLGILIVFGAIGWLVNSFFASWANDMLQSATTSVELQELMNTGENIFDEAFDTGGGNGNTVVNSAGGQTTVIVVTATPVADDGLLNAAPRNSPSRTGEQRLHVVAPGDTLFGIAEAYGTTIHDLMVLNELTTYTIHPQDVLLIPDPTP